MVFILRKNLILINYAHTDTVDQWKINGFSENQLQCIVLSDLTELKYIWRTEPLFTERTTLQSRA